MGGGTKVYETFVRAVPNSVTFKEGQAVLMERMLSVGGSGIPSAAKATEFVKMMRKMVSGRQKKTMVHGVCSLLGPRHAPARW
jgi:hypothetical protein